jgi:aminocarboxymuconate-semialdehyde decarboxylase
MRSLDVHTHVLPPELPGWSPIRLERAGVECRARMLREDGTVFREIESNCWDPARRLRECDAVGVGVQVLSAVPVFFAYHLPSKRGYDLARLLNDHVAELCREHPRRFIGLGTLPLQSPDLAARELERCVEQGLAGAQIGSHVNDWNLSDAALFPVFAHAAELGAALFVHPWDMMAQAKMQKYWLPWLVGMPAEVSLAICSVIFGGVLERLPRLRIAFAHGGGSFPGTFGRIEHGFHARPDLVAVDNPHPPSAYLKRIYVDSLVHEARALRLVLDLFGSERVALGTDYPFPLGEGRPGALIDSLKLEAPVRDRLRFGTALEWLGRAPESYDL